MFKTIQQDAFSVIGIALKADNTDPAVGEKIGAHWQRFFADGVPDRLPGRVDQAFVAVYTDYEGDHSKPYSLVVGCRVDGAATAPEGMVKVDVPAQSYAMTTAKGPMPDAVVQGWQAIWASDLARAYVADFEVYDERAQDPARAEVDILVSIAS